MEDIPTIMDESGTAGDYSGSSRRSRRPGYTGGQGLATPSIFRRARNAPTESDTAGPSHPPQGDVRFTMAGGVVPLDNVAVPARRDTMPPPPPLSMEEEVALLRREVLALKQAREEPQVSKPRKRTGTKRRPFRARAEAARSRVFTRHGLLPETNFTEGSVTASSSRAPTSRGAVNPSQGAATSQVRGRRSAEGAAGYRGESGGNPSATWESDLRLGRSDDRRGTQRPVRSVDRQGAREVLPEGSRRGLRHRLTFPEDVSPSSSGYRGRWSNSADGYEVRRDGASLVLVNTRTGSERVYRADRGDDVPEASSPRHGPSKRRRGPRPTTAAARPHPDHSDSRLEKARQSPFVRRVAEAIPPRGFKIPKFDKYEPTTDAVIHVQQYRLVSELYGHSDAIMCKTFSMSLGTTALLWYGQLAPGSIASFDELERAFTTRFVTSNTQPKTLDALVNMKRRSDECLKDYIARYWEVYSLVENCDQKVGATSFKNGLDDSSDLFKDLMIRPPRDMSELMATVDRFRELEELMSSKAQKGGGPKSSPKWFGRTG